MPNDAITLTPTATGHAFTRNPIFLNMPGTGKRVFSIYGQGYTSQNPAYKGEVTAPARINLAEFIEAIIPSIEDPGENSEKIKYGLHDGNVTILVTDGQDTLFTREIRALPGGVSKQNYRKLTQASTDIFAARFLNPSCNFFLTTRTHDWRLNIKETELYPLVFFFPQNGYLNVKDPDTGNTLRFNGLGGPSNLTNFHGKLCSINLQAIRLYFLNQYNSLPSLFDITADDGPAARIAVQEAKPQHEHYRLKFRNSFGAFEIVELTGNAQWAPEINGDQEEQQYQRYQADIDDFTTERQRAELTRTVNLSTGYKTKQELLFILDAVASEETYLLDLAEEPVKVIVTAEEMTFDQRPNGPQSFNLKLTPVEKDRSLTSDLVSAAMPVRGGLFSPEFTDIFD